MGVYGVEGSKLGVVVIVVWLMYKMIGLYNDGYGRLLGEVVFFCIKVCLEYFFQFEVVGCWGF